MNYNKETIEQNIHTKWAGKTVHFAKEMDSTNLWIKRLAKEGAPQGADVWDVPGRFRRALP